MGITTYNLQHLFAIVHLLLWAIVTTYNIDAVQLLTPFMKQMQQLSSKGHNCLCSDLRTRCNQYKTVLTQHCQPIEHPLVLTLLEILLQ